MNIVFCIICIIVLLLLAAILYFTCSPMPVVRLMRRKMEDSLSYPKDYERIKERVEVYRNLTYPSKFKQNNFDLYLPKGQGSYPLILWVHGGAFVAGDKSGIENWGIILAGNGYGVAAMNYAWAPEAVYPAQIQQVAEALSAIMEMPQTKVIDKSRVAVAGDSAGAYMAAQFAMAHTNPDLSAQISVVSPLLKESLKCALLYCGPYDITQLLQIKKKMLRLFISRVGWSFLGKKNWKKSNYIHTLTPMDYVTKDSVPFYITDGNAWSFENHGRTFGDALRKHSVYVRERYFPKEEGEVNHEYQMQLETKNAMLCFQDTLDFLAEYL